MRSVRAFAISIGIVALFICVGLVLLVSDYSIPVGSQGSLFREHDGDWALAVDWDAGQAGPTDGLREEGFYGGVIVARRIAAYGSAPSLLFGMTENQGRHSWFILDSTASPDAFVYEREEVFRKALEARGIYDATLRKPGIAEADWKTANWRVPMFLVGAGLIMAAICWRALRSPGRWSAAG